MTGNFTSVAALTVTLTSYFEDGWYSVFCFSIYLPVQFHHTVMVSFVWLCNSEHVGARWSLGITQYPHTFQASLFKILQGCCWKKWSLVCRVKCYHAPSENKIFNSVSRHKTYISCNILCFGGNVGRCEIVINV
jgi:hypothetical protein